MEENSVIQNQNPLKKQKLNEEQDIDGNSKSLSNLPEGVLLHILSFLPTKDAVRTSVLSKRCDYRWISITNLDFEQSSRDKRILLMNFVERALCLRGSSDIKQFTLSCDVCDASRVNTWISTAMRHNVQELHIKLDDFNGELSLPYCLFTCKTLTNLHLDIPLVLKLPSIFCFSNLKILTFQNVTFSDDHLTQQLLSSHPVVEKLSLHVCSWGAIKVVSISAPKLHFLSIVESDVENSSFVDGCQFMIFGGSLKEFCYIGYLLNDYSLHKSFSLEKAEIDAFINDKPKHIAYRMYKLLMGLSNVKFLRLSSDVVEALIYAEELIPHMPMFNNLMDLEFFVGMSVDLGCVALLRILHTSPCLMTLQFVTGIHLYSDREILNPLPSCFLSHLKRIKVGNYNGYEKELSVVKTFLKSAIILDELVISWSEKFAGELEKQENHYKQLIELPKGSQNCNIILEQDILEL